MFGLKVFLWLLNTTLSAFNTWLYIQDHQPLNLVAAVCCFGAAVLVFPTK